MKVLTHGYEQVDTMEYELELLDTEGNLGQDYAGYLPRVERAEGHLLLLSSHFGSGLLLSGSTGQGEAGVCEHVLSERAAKFAKRGRRQIPSNSVVVNFVSGRLPSFPEAEELACQPPPACQLHKDCGDYCFQGEKVSRAEKAALERMEASPFRREDGKLQLSYPFNERALQQRDNRFQVKQIQEKVEDTVSKKGVEDEYRNEMRKAIDAGSLRELSKEEMESWHGPVHYVSHFGVVNQESASTKVRVVTNSAMKNAVTKLSFNDTTDNVPNALSDIYDVMVQWRGFPVAVMYDLSKAYHSIKTGEL